MRQTTKPRAQCAPYACGGLRGSIHRRVRTAHAVGSHAERRKSIQRGCAPRTQAVGSGACGGQCGGRTQPRAQCAPYACSGSFLIGITPTPPGSCVIGRGLILTECAISGYISGRRPPRLDIDPRAAMLAKPVDVPFFRWLESTMKTRLRRPLCCPRPFAPRA
jgi:hypothetical protein